MYSQPEENTSGKVFFIFSGDFHRARQIFCLLSDKLSVVYADILDPFSDTVVENDPHIPEKPFFHPFALSVL